MIEFLSVVGYLAVAAVYAAVLIAKHYQREYARVEEGTGRQQPVQRPDEIVFFFAACWPLMLFVMLPFVYTVRTMDRIIRQSVKRSRGKKEHAQP